MSKNFIELNGKRYDAVSGALLGAVPKAEPEPPRKVTVQVEQAPPAAKKPRRDHHIAQPKPAHGRRPQTPKTLIRRAVSKPAAETKSVVRKHYPIATNNVHSRIAIKNPAASVDATRLKRAQAIHKSSTVQRFPAAQQAPVSSPPQPAATPATRAIPVRVAPVRVAPAPAAHSKQTVSKPTAPAKVNIFEQALADAKSHEEPEHRPLKVRKSRKAFRRKLVNATAGVMAVLLVGGFVAYLNRDTIQFEYASLQAGFQASKPSYTPSGYVASATTGEKGKVTIGFASTNADQSFTLTQQSSNWDSQDLFDDIVARHETTYQTIQSGGRTIYLYGDNEAAWVNGGILYTVHGDAALEAEQLISLAGSL